MHHGSDRAHSHTGGHDFGRRLSGAIDDYRAVLDGVAAMRSMSSVPTWLIDEVLAVKELKVLRISWELWDALVAGCGGDPEIELLDHVPIADLEMATAALWGRTFCGTVDN